MVGCTHCYEGKLGLKRVCPSSTCKNKDGIPAVTANQTFCPECGLSTVLQCPHTQCKRNGRGLYE